MPDWSHQDRAVEAVFAARARGVKSACLTSPTGSGKSRIGLSVAQRLLGEGKRVSLYTNRRLMVTQWSQAILEAGQYHGIRAAGHEDEREHPLQICSIQTEDARTLKRGQWELHACRPGDMAIIDEGHLHVAEVARKIRDRHKAGGAMTLDLTATPLDMGGVCEELIVGATVPELIEAGVIVPAHHFGPDEPDLAKFKRIRSKVQNNQPVSENDARHVMMTPGIMGRVSKWFEQLNPSHKPTLLFGPGVKECIWFAERFAEIGITAAHIDGEHIWMDGELHRSSQSLREELLARSQAGEIKVVCNRFVLREAVDMPWIEHIIAATMFSDLQSYLQTCGRGCRTYPGKEFYTVQDHGGNWWRFGSLNEERKWKLEYASGMLEAIRADRLRARKDKEPRRCPKCAKIVKFHICPCGYEFKGDKQARPVVSTDDTVRHLSGSLFMPRTISTQANGAALWRIMYWRARSDKWDATFRQAIAMYAQENSWQWPNPAWPLMPVNSDHIVRKVKDVPFRELIGYCPTCDKCPCECGKPRQKRESLFT